MEVKENKNNVKKKGLYCLQKQLHPMKGMESATCGLLIVVGRMLYQLVHRGAQTQFRFYVSMKSLFF